MARFAAAVMVAAAAWLIAGNPSVKAQVTQPQRGMTPLPPPAVTTPNGS